MIQVTADATNQGFLRLPRYNKLMSYALCPALRSMAVDADQTW